MKTKKNLVRTVAVGGVATLALTMAAPGYAATIVGQSSAAALEISVAGEGSDSGRVTATVDSNGNEVVEGQVNPPIDVLDGQRLLNLGVLAQEANAFLDGRAGISEACSGVAGEGGAVAQIGDSGCLTPGQPIDVSIANLDLTGTRLADPDSALAPLNDATDPVLQQLVGPATAAISDGLSQLGTVGLGGTLGAVQAFCEAEPGVATGDATLVNSQLTADVNGTEVVLLDFPANPDPNTEVVTELDEVVVLLLDALRTDLNNSFDGAGSELEAVPDAIQEQIVETVVADVAGQLQPLEDNILRATLNKQTTTGDGQISVTALDLAVLPGAQDSPLAAPLVEAAIANVTCGPNAVAGELEAPGQPGEPTDVEAPALPAVPTAVDSGTEGDDGTLLGGLMLALAGAVAATGYRRRSAARG
jgi:hypothetical protein